MADPSLFLLYLHLRFRFRLPYDGRMWGDLVVVVGSVGVTLEVEGVDYTIDQREPPFFS